MKSVKLLSETAKQLMEQKLRDWHVRKSACENLSRTYDNEIFREINRKELQVLNEAIQQYQTFVSQPDYWTRDKIEAFAFIAPTGTISEIFGKQIKGAVVLCYNSFFEVRGPYSKEEAKLLVEKKVRKLRGEVEYLTFRKSTPQNDSSYERMPIPEDVRNEVWRRDQGKCVRCSSVRNLEFDHLIPIVKGGSNTARNIQLLCEACNRQKSDSI